MMMKNINSRIAILLLAVMGIGVMSMWWMVRKIDKDMRSALLGQARISASAVNIERLSSLSGSKEDLNSRNYQRIKVQLDDGKFNKE